MTNEQILEHQVEALEKLLKLKQAVVEELEAKVARLQYPYLGGGISPQPYIQPIGGGLQGGAGGYGNSGTIIICNHEYPSMWGGTGTPPCIKCGQPFSNAGSVTVTGYTTSGYIAPTNSGAAGGLLFTPTALQDLVNSSAK